MMHGRDGRRPLWAPADVPTRPYGQRQQGELSCVRIRQMPKAGRGVPRPIHGSHGLGSASRAHLVVGLAGLVTADGADFAAGIDCVVLVVVVDLVVAVNLVSGADLVVLTTVKAGLGCAGFATPMTLSSESRRKCTLRNPAVIAPATGELLCVVSLVYL